MKAESANSVLHVNSQLPTFALWKAALWNSYPVSILQRMSTIHFIASGVIATAAASTVAQNDVWRLTSFLCLGAALGVLWSCLSRVGQEASKMTKARVLAGVVGGICVPRFVELVSPWKLHLDNADPLLIILIGFIFAVLGFYAMHAGLRRVESREKAIGGMLTKTLERTIEAATGNKADADNQSNSTGNPNDATPTPNH